MKNIEKDLYFSCPGKVLISGGYSILKSENIGISLAINSRFYAKSRLIDDITIEEMLLIKFISPQIESEWVYSIKDFEKSLILKDISKDKNSFLEAIVTVFFTYVKTMKKFILNRKILEIQIFNDKEFYSKNCMKHQNNNEKFPMFDVKRLKKTGLGSSACLIVSIITSLMDSFGFFENQEFSSHYTIIHLLSQITNIIAQNKIGSGFDISTAVYGSQLFQKLPETLINENFLSNFSKMTNFQMINKELEPIIRVFQEYEKNLIKIPKTDKKFVLIDFTVGSDTRILVSKVKEYLKENDEFVNKFYEKSNEMSEILHQYILKNDNFDKINEKCKNYREILKELGVRSKVEIEPDVITLIIDFLQSIENNILYCVCPGAGGYDAACCLIKQDCNINIEEFIKEFNEIKAGNNHLDVLKDIYKKKKSAFIQDFDEIMQKLKNIEISIIESKIDNDGGLNYVKI